MSTTSAVSAGDLLPHGVVTFLFTDIQGSTQLLRRLGDGYPEVLGTHQRLLREIFARHRGCEVDTQGDSFFVAFSSVRESIAAAGEAQQALYGYPWPHGEPVLVRMGLHTGEALLVDGHYVGMDVHRAARIANAGHGGQVLVSARSLELAGGTPVKDLGEHRLKDLERPERLYQLLVEGVPDTFPALKSLGSPTNVPHHVSSLVGRSEERRQLRALLEDPAVRLVTVTGMGGTGKTRLGAHVALEALELFPDGVYFVDLSAVSSPAAVAPAIAEVLGVTAEGDASVEERLRQHLANRTLLLLLDNVEHVLPAGVMVSALLEATTRVTVLATSQFPLGIQGEHEYPLDTLSLPADDSLAQVGASDAVQLFVQRATQVRPSFRLTIQNAAAVAQVCRLLDGLPLAIELAAARTRLFTPQVLVRRLDDRLGLLSGGPADAPERHRGLRATIDWSVDLLSAEERQFFSDLCVFSGGASLEAVEAVVPVSDGHALDLLESLVNHSLVRQRQPDHGEPRFQILQVLRDYGLEVARASPARLQAVRVRHADHFLDLATRVRGPNPGPAPQEHVLDEERDNLEAALQFCLDEAARGDGAAGDRAVRLAGRLGHHWYMHGQAREGSRLLELALASSPHPPADDEALALHFLGVLLQHTGQANRAVEVLERAVALRQEAGDRDGEAASLNSLGAGLRYLSRLQEAQDRLWEAAAIRKELNQQGGLINVHNNIGLVLVDRGRVAEAKRLFADNLVLDRERGDAWGAACSMLNLGVAQLVEDDPDGAAPLIGDALGVFLEQEDSDGAAETLEACVGVGVARGRWTAAARVAAATEAFRRRTGLVASGPERVLIDRWTVRCREELSAEAFQQAWSEGAQMTLEQAAAYARSEVLRTPRTTD
ncbi:ATP-binding protein [Ornithinimicrobium sp. LYQ121]|uniref:ATP-binding protein n=1 Tax=Ornithinimicrobium sp. LYQ121 TaxID=3378801 RepID=UPI003855458C